MASKWYNPMSWSWFGFNDPVTGQYIEVEQDIGGQTRAGAVITPKKAMAIPIVWSCIKILSETVSGLPLKLYDDQPGGRALVKGKNRSARILAKPNPFMTMLNFIKAVIVNMALRGNAFAIIERSDDGEVIGLIPLSADAVEVNTDEDLIYWVTSKGERFPVSPENMLHFKLFSADGINGLSPVEFHKESMGLAKTAQDWSARFMRKGGFTGGYVIYDNFLTREQRDQVLAKFPKIREGDVEDIGKMGLLEGGPKIVPAGLSQKDSQFIESQQFQEEALAGIWGVPLYLANRAGKTSIMGSNLEQQTSGFITFGLSPYIKAIEDEINDKLFGGTTQFVEFVVEGILRADSAGRAAYYNSALGGSGGPGWMTINEVRRKENLPPLTGEEYDRVTRWEMQTNAKQP
ncbi:phage portal protein [Pseudomonas monteilii]|uniref:phage portal protein n=1 Tax=Pseudomonas monteilii TaxID=76759 RepID=UPI000CEB3BFB|nr:phage portal protein [Pseudomonas monteilii]AVH37015.1 phage portal protein [Pseudomonas monteilii]